METWEARGVFLDLDGVVWRGDEAVEGAPEMIERLKAHGFKIRYVSNNSGLGKERMLQKFDRLGITVDPEELILATEFLARSLARKQNRGTVYLIGSEGLKRDLEAQGLRVIDEPEEIDYLTDFVVVASDRSINYTKLLRAMRCIHKGALVGAANVDLTYPTEEGLVPGSGAFVAAVCAMSKRDPDFLVGKPKPDLLLAAAKSAELDVSECVMVGDTPETDIRAAHAAGMRSILVLSGNVSAADASQSDPPPTLIMPSIVDVAELLIKANS